MTNAKNRILGRLKKSSATPVLPNGHTWAHSQEGAVRPKQRDTANNRVQDFIEALQANHAQVYVCDHKDWTATLEKLAIEKHLKIWMLGSGLKEIELTTSALNNTKVVEKVYSFKHQFEDIKSVLFHKVDASFTTAQAGIAETGTILLTPDRNEPRTLSLIPPTHVIKINASQVVSTLADAIDKLTPILENLPTPSNLVFISSPSKTADIQQTLAYGAHGPKELIVIITIDY